jgi:peroxiredoxin
MQALLIGGGAEVGTKAPGFNLKDQNDQDVSLDDLIRTGPVAIIFFRSASW